MPVFTYLANALRKGDRVVPYSLVTATDLSLVQRSVAATAPPQAAASSAASQHQPSAPRRHDTGAQSVRRRDVLNTWTARELAAAAGDRVALDYYLWDPVAGLQTKSAEFTVSAVVPMAGMAADRHLAPEYPGITEAESLSDWDPPFPIDLSRVGPSMKPTGTNTGRRRRHSWATSVAATCGGLDTAR